MKKNFILGGILILLIVITYIYRGPLKQWQNSLGKTENFFSKFNTESIDAIEIIKNNQTEKFEKSGDFWIISGTKGLKVDMQILNKFFDDLNVAGSLPMDLISTNPDKKSSFMTDNSGTVLKIFKKEEPIIDIVVGKTGSDFISTYVSKANIKETYSIKVNLRTFLDQPTWADKVIFSFNPEDIKKIRFQEMKNEYKFEKKDKNWVVVSGKRKVEVDKIEKAIKTLSNLKAISIPEQNFKGTGLEKNLLIVEVKGDNVSATIMIGNNNGEKLYYAKRSDSDIIYLINEDDFKTLKY